MQFIHPPPAKQFGDAIFETLRLHNGAPVFMRLHLARLFRGMKALGYLVPPMQEFLTELRESTRQAWLHCGSPPVARARWLVFRETYEGYRPGPEELLVSVTVAPYQDSSAPRSGGIPVRKALVVGHLRHWRTPFSHLKTTHRAPTVAAAAWVARQGYAEGLIMDNRCRAVEFLAGNLFAFIRNEGLLLTPPLASGALAGSLRSLMLQELAPRLGWQVRVAHLPLKKLQYADLVFHTNAIRRITWVNEIWKPGNRKEPLHSATDATELHWALDLLVALEEAHTGWESL